MRPTSPFIVIATLGALVSVVGSLPTAAQSPLITVSSPSVYLGAESAGAMTFTRIRAVVPLPDGRFAVADAGDELLVIVDPSSGSTEDWGWKGSGPGEFRSLQGLWRDGTVLVAFDPRAMRLTSFSPDGQVDATTRLTNPPPGTGHPDMPLGAPVGGKLYFGALSGTQPEGGFSEDVLTLVRYSASGEFEASLGSVVNLLRHYAPGAVGAHALSPAASIAGALSEVYLGDGSEPVVRRFSLTGTELDPIVLSDLPEPPSRAAAWEVLERKLDEGILSGRWAAALEAQPRGVGEVPHYSAFVADAVDGSLWVKEFDAESDYRPLPGGRKPGGVWHRIDAAGRTLERYAMPDRFVLLGVEGGQLLGYTLGSFDEHILTVFDAVIPD